MRMVKLFESKAGISGKITTRRPNLFSAIIYNLFTSFDTAYNFK